MPVPSGSGLEKRLQIRIPLSRLGTVVQVTHSTSSARNEKQRLQARAHSARRRCLLPALTIAVGDREMRTNHALAGLHRLLRIPRSFPWPSPTAPVGLRSSLSSIICSVPNASFATLPRSWPLPFPPFRSHSPVSLPSRVCGWTAALFENMLQCNSVPLPRSRALSSISNPPCPCPSLMILLTPSTSATICILVPVWN